MDCPICGDGELEQQRVETWIKRGERWALIRGARALVCNNCGDQSFDQRTAEQIATIADVQAYPVRPTSMETFSIFDLSEIETGTGHTAPRCTRKSLA